MINRRADRPLRKQLADILREQITSGQYPPGTFIPSLPTLAGMFGVSEPTARAAVAILVSEGLVVVDPPYGTRVRDQFERTVVKVPRGSRLRTRPPTVEERLELDLDDGEQVTEVIFGGRTRRYPAGSTEFTFS